MLNDYKMVVLSREASLVGRREVFMGKAKFGIFGDGKELAQVAMAKVFRDGDFRSGYYRDQTFAFATGLATPQQYFAQLYAHTDQEADPFSSGRQMVCHFATPLNDEQGTLLPLARQKNIISDISPTAGQMPRLVGLAYASKLFRENKQLHSFSDLSDQGNEIAFGTIGNASTSEGLFLESINALGVLQAPAVIAVWDDDYGISVPQKYHTTKESISEALKGFQRTKNKEGFEILTVNGWDYERLVKAFEKAEEFARTEHIPVLIHVQQMTQPQGHSTSGSHERYKTKERLEWELEHDCITTFRDYLLTNGYAEEQELEVIHKEAKKEVKQAKELAWKAFTQDIRQEQEEVLSLLKNLHDSSAKKEEIDQLHSTLKQTLNPIRSDNHKIARRALRAVTGEDTEARRELQSWLEAKKEENYNRYNSNLYSETQYGAIHVERVKPEYIDTSEIVDGREVLQACFDAALERDPRVFAIGEDVGKIGDVNQGFAGLQDKYGELRVTDTGIREPTIIGQGIGAALRGLRPITEIQYLDYIFYAMQTLTDDLSTLHYRTNGIQSAPLIIRTRGHRLEGIWHSGSLIGTLLHSLRGIYVLVPRNMTKAAAFYNTMLKSNDPALLIECLNGYRLKEKLPENVGEMTEPLGVPEIIKEGSDVTIVTYGSMCRIVMDAAMDLEGIGISCEVIDVQTLIPFDKHHRIIESVKKTNRVVFADEDVPGGASSYMMQNVVEYQGGYKYLDSQPITITAKDHRPAYASDGDYFSKPSVEDVYEAVYGIMEEYDPVRFPKL